MHVRHFFFSVAVYCSLVSSDLSADEIQFERDVVPVLQAHCIRCHGPEVQEAKVRLDNLSTNLSEDRAAVETWHEVLNVLQAGEMPPKDEPQLSAQQLSTLTNWVSKSIKVALADRQKTDGRVILRRLNRVERNLGDTALYSLARLSAIDSPTKACVGHFLATYLMARVAGVEIFRADMIA